MSDVSILRVLPTLWLFSLMHKREGGREREREGGRERAPPMNPYLVFVFIYINAVTEKANNAVASSF